MQQILLVLTVPKANPRDSDSAALEWVKEDSSGTAFPGRQTSNQITLALLEKKHV